MNLKELFEQRKWRLTISFLLGLVGFVYGFIVTNVKCIDVSACEVYKSKIFMGLTLFVIIFVISYLVQFIIKKIIEKS